MTNSDHKNDNALVKLDAARVALAECKTVMEVKQIADMAEAARVYLERTQASVETVNRATEIRLLAERQMGEFLKQMPKNTGTAGQLIGPGKIGAQRDQAPTLKEIGLTHSDSHRAQKLADIPAPEFRERIETAKAEGKLSTASIIRTRRPQQVWSRSAWERQTRGIMTSWIEQVPEEDRTWAAKYLADLPTRILHDISK